jgi:hypothetical protein
MALLKDGTRIYGNAIVDGNIAVSNIYSGGNTWTFGADAILTLPDGGYIDNNGGITRLGAAGNVGAQIGSSDTQNYVTASNQGVTIQTLADTVNSSWLFGLDGNLTIPGNVTVGMDGDFTKTLTVDGTLHVAFDNLYAAGGDITADKNVYVGRLQISDQPNDLPIPGITTGNVAIDFSLGSPNDTGNLLVSRTIIRNGNRGVADIIPGKSVDPTINPNSATVIYTASDSSIIALEIRVNFQYGSTSDSDTELASVYVTRNSGGNVSVTVGTVSTTSGTIAPATYFATVNGDGAIELHATTDATASTAYYRVRVVEFGGFFGV